MKSFSRDLLRDFLKTGVLMSPWRQVVCKIFHSFSLHLQPPE